MSIDHAERDIFYMKLALALAEKGRYTTRPNPAVGCVIVKDDQIIGEGFHPKAGEPHAEVFALRDAKAKGFDVAGATAYVTLEPCFHHGRTPPCADALIHANVARVVMATLDANPQVAGQGRTKLEQAGIETTVGVCEAQARELNAGFLKTMAGGLPFVRLKMASSLDGRTAMASGESKWITGSVARVDVQYFRALSGAIITGINTVLADDPLLNVRLLDDVNGDSIENLHLMPQPLRVILDRHGRLAKQLPNAKILNDEPVLIVGDTSIFGHFHFNKPELVDVLAHLKSEFNVHDVLVEAGQTLAGAFLQAGLVDELIVYLAPTLLGSLAKPMFDLPFHQMSEQIRWQIQSVTQVGDDLRVILHPQKNG